MTIIIKKKLLNMLNTCSCLAHCSSIFYVNPLKTLHASLRLYATIRCGWVQLVWLGVLLWHGRSSVKLV